MLRALYLSFFLLATTQLFSMAVLNVQTATADVLKEYKKSEATLKTMKKRFSSLYDTVTEKINKMISSHQQAYDDKIKNTIDADYNAIAEQGGAFVAKKNQFVITDIDPAATTIHSFIGKLYSVMANRDFFKQLWQRLTAKEKELIAQFEALEKSALVMD